MTTIIVPLYNYINQKVKRFWNINELAKKCKLSFSRQETVGSKLIGLDKFKRKLLYLMHHNNNPRCCIIDLKEVKSCSVKKEYDSINAGDLKRKKLEDYLHTICLHFCFKNGRKAIALPFYEKKNNNIFEIPELEAKAKAWVTILSKLLPVPANERA